jgi:hypothetical protein
MKELTKYITLGGTVLILLTAFMASTQGWGLSSLTDPQTLRESRRSCPEHQKDRYGNCPPTRHRVRMGSRAHFGGGGK